LSPELRKTYGKRSFRIIKGDTVKVLRGDFAGESGIIDDVNVNRCAVFIHGVSVTKADGTEVPRPINPSNVQITKLNLKDNYRRARVGESGE